MPSPGAHDESTPDPTASEMTMPRRIVPPDALPFSFTYDGRASRELFARMGRTDTARTLDAHRAERTQTLVDSDAGLEVRRVEVAYNDFPVLEWTVYIKNTSERDSLRLADIQALDLSLDGESDGRTYALRHHTGDYYTADSFEPHCETLGCGASRRFAPEGGRPCNKAFPYFNVSWPGAGLICAIGWPGQWAAQFAVDDASGLRLVAGQELTDLVLRPGEEIRTPLVVLQMWEGDDWVRAQNIWRRWMLAHNTPRPGGEAPAPMLSTCLGLFQNEKDERGHIDSYADNDIGLTHWWMDAGWYTHSRPVPSTDYWVNTGTWEYDATRFPGGIKAVSDYARSKDMEFILWFEPERVTPGSELAEKHAGWLLGKADGHRLLDLGNPDARQWLTDHIDRFLGEQGIDLYRQDFNIDPLPFWRANDAPDRQGITEIRYVEGYLAYWDELLRRHPGMLIDSCASGGRRNDVETLRRSVPLLRSDYQCAPERADGNQGHTYGLSFWMPYHGTGVPYNDTYTVHSHLCPALGIGVAVEGPTDFGVMRRRADEWRRIARYFYGDYYPLTSYSLAPDAWMAWQFHRPDLDAGMVQAFRHADSPYETARFSVHGLDASAEYELTDLDDDSTTRVGGRTLIDGGCQVTLLERRSSALIAYARVE